MRRSASAFFLLALLSIAPQAQLVEASISGRVTDDAGAPVASAQVGLVNMGLVAITQSDGSYHLTIPAARANGQQATLSARHLGLKPKVISVTLKPGTQTFDFVLPPQAVVLQQVVITGEGTFTTSEKLGETVNTVPGSDLVNSNETNLVNALSGKAPNVQIQSQSGDPGSSTSIEIRGVKSLSGDGQPLFVVDGVPVDNSTIPTTDPIEGVVAPNRIADVNPADIESVTILKGAAASAIYGARASQGVVLITTKEGKSGATRYSLNATYSANDVTQGFPLQTKYGSSFVCTVPDCFATGTDAETWGPLLAPGTKTYDHFHEMFETGSIWDIMLSISGGDDHRSFYFSGGYTANQGFVAGPTDYYNRVTINLKASQTLADRMRVSVKMSYVNTSGSYVQRGSNIDGLMLGGLRTPPDFDNRHYLDTVLGLALHRAYRFPEPTPASLTTTRGFDNPFFVINEMSNTSSLQRFYGNLNIVWTASDWFTLQWTPGTDYYYTDSRLMGYPLTTSRIPIGAVLRTDNQNFIVSSTLTAVAQHTFNPDFSGTVTAGNEINLTNSSQLSAYGDGLIAPEPLVLSNTQNAYVPSDYEQKIHRQSFFAQVTTDLYDQLFLTLAIRNDGYSTFAQNDPRAWYPKASAAWTFTKAMDVSGHGVLQYGKLRAAYGETGKEPDSYSTLNSYFPASFGGGFISNGALGSDSLRPERQKELEAGFDLGFLDGWLSLSATAYLSRANDVIMQIPLPITSGANSEVFNGASIENKGAEVQLNVTSPGKDRNLQWTLGLLWGLNRNTVTGLANGITEVGAGNGAIVGTTARIGYPVGSFVGGDFARCGRGDVLYDGTALDSTVCVGQKKGTMYIAADGFPVLLNNEYILGSSQPDWAGSVRGTITVRQKLQFSFLVDIRHGSQAYNGTRGALYDYGTHKDTEIRGQLRTFGADFHPGPVVGPGAGKQVVIDYNWFAGDGGAFSNNVADFIENAGFTKLREIGVQYTLDGPWVTRSLGLSSVNLRIAGRNLYTWTNYTGLDPETNLSGAVGFVQGTDWFNNPQTRSLVFSIGLNR